MRRTSLSKNGKNKTRLHPNRKSGEQNKAKPRCRRDSALAEIGEGGIKNPIFKNKKY